MTDTVTIPEVGAAAEPRTFGPITRTDIVRYAGASGDFNPIHHDEQFAAKAGFPTVFSIGMFQAALLATYATDWLGPSNVRRFTVQFREQVWPDDELTCAGRVTAVQRCTEGTQIDVELTCARQTGSLAIAGSATFVLPVETDIA
jgi:acyl dehydratase